MLVGFQKPVDIFTFLELKEFLNIQGNLTYFGEPAEKVQGSKPIHALKGYYDGLDAMISYHPFYMPPQFRTATLPKAGSLDLDRVWRIMRWQI